MPFLRAEWRKLAIANYAVDKDLLLPFVPAKTQLDIWQDTCYVSLVAFRFLNTRLRGLAIPFHTDFEEANLRFYVRHRSGAGWRRGVVFIKEIVPKPAIAFVANKFYRERYASMPMRHHWEESRPEQLIEYGWKTKEEWQTFSIRAKSLSQAIPEGSEAEFITEHYWGYTQAGPETTFEYEVSHPRWEIYPVLEHDIRVDFARTYGAPFSFLNDLQPRSVMLAEGSHVAVGKKNRV